MVDIFNPSNTLFSPVRDSSDFFEDPQAQNPFTDIAEDNSIVDLWEERPDGPSWRQEWQRWGEYTLGEQVSRPAYTPAQDIDPMSIAQSIGMGHLWTQLGLPGATPLDRAIRTGLTNVMKDVQSDGTLAPEDVLARTSYAFARAEMLRKMPKFAQMSPIAQGVFGPLVNAVLKDAYYHDTPNFYDGTKGLPEFEEIIDNPFLPDEDKDIIFDIGDLIDEWIDENPPPTEEPTAPTNPTDPTDPTQPPDGYVCPPCPSTDCYAPDNIPLIEEIIDKLNALQNDGVEVDFTEVNKKITDLSDRITVLGEQVTAGFEQLSDLVQQILDLLNDEFPSLRDTLDAIDTKLDDFITALNEKVDDITTTADNIWAILNDEATIRIEASACDAAQDDAPQIFEVVAPRIVAIAQAFPLLGKVLQFHSQQVCEIDPTAAVPEWWATRVGADRPQAVISFRAKTSNGKWAPSTYPVSIPWAKDIAGTPTLSPYWKGNHYGHLILSDNSKLIVNCKSQSEAERVLGQLSSLIERDKLKGAIERYGTTKGPEIKQQQVYPRYMFYFSTGQKDTMPDWRREFR